MNPRDPQALADAKAKMQAAETQLAGAVADLKRGGWLETIKGVQHPLDLVQIYTGPKGMFWYLEGNGPDCGADT